MPLQDSEISDSPASRSDLQSLTDRMRAVAAAAAGVIGARSPRALRQVLEEACRTVISFDAFFILGYDAESQTFHGFGGVDADQQSPPNTVPAAGTPGERVVRTKKSLVTGRADEPAARGAFLTGTGRRSESVIRTPILSEEKVLGMLSVQSYTQDLYTSDDVQVVEVIASLAATSILNLRLTAERKTAESALLERERQLEEAQRMAALGSWTWEVESDRITWSAELYRIYGVDRSSARLDFEFYLQRVHEDDREMVRRTVASALETGDRCEFEERIIRPGGEQRILRSSCEPVRDEAGRVTRLMGVCQDVTELKRSEMALRASEESYRTIFELASDAIFVHDIETGAILDANRRATELYDCGLEELKRLGIAGISEGVAPFDQEHAREYVRRAAEGEPQRFEWRIRNRAGELFWVEVSLRRVRILGEIRVVASVRNIDERKQAEKALQRAHDELEDRVRRRTAELARRTDDLKRAEQRFRAIVEASPNPLVLSRVSDGVIVYGNDRLEQLIGVPPGGLHGRKTTDFYHDPADRWQIVETIARDGYVRSLELQLKRVDGQVLWVSLSVQRLLFDGEDVLATSLLDITDRKDAEAALQRSEAHFRRLIENASDLISIVRPDGTISYQSPAVTRMLGYAPAELSGETLFELIAPEDVEEVRGAFQRIVNRPGTPVVVEARFRHKDGTWRHVEAVGTTLSATSADDGIVLNSRDVSERKEAEATLRFQKTLLEAQGEASIDGILVVSDAGKMISWNQRFVDMWRIPPGVLLSESDDEAIGHVLAQVARPEEFQERIGYLYANPQTRSRDEIVLKDGRVLDRYTAPVMSAENDYYGRIWFFRDMTAQKRYTEVLDTARREAEEAKERASRYAGELERELDVGRQIQRGFLPSSIPQPNGWEIAGRVRPASRVAGDFFDVFELGGRMGLVVADVCGKGVGAALFMALFQSLLRAYAEREAASSSSLSARGILREATTATNGYIMRVHKATHMFASVFFGLLDSETGDLQYVNAGHEPPVIRRSDGSLLRLQPTGPALGIIADTEFGVGQMVIEAGDTFLGFTDGVTEARNERREFFTESRMLDLVREPIGSAATLLDRIESDVDHFAGMASPSDDLTLLAVRRIASNT